MMQALRGGRAVLVALALLTSSEALAQACGGEGQSACSVFVRTPSCDSYLVESSGRCVHPPCGREGDRACSVFERVPSCDINLGEVGGRCVSPTPCGNEEERECRFWEHVPSCRSPDLVAVANRCTHPPCGKLDGRACSVVERIPSCDVGLIEVRGFCGRPTPCGREGQRECRVYENIPSCRSPELVAFAGSCVHPPCGRNGQVACTVAQRIPSCDEALVEAAGRCGPRTPCGNEGERECSIPEHVPSCRAVELVAANGICVHPPCGRQGEPACTVVQRFPSCDTALIEVAGRCGPSSHCGDEGERECLVWEWFPSCRSPSLVASGGRCVHPPCGRAGQAACAVTVRIPSCDVSLLDVAGICRARECGRAATPACKPDPLVRACEDGTVEVRGICIQRSHCSGRGERACTVAEHGLDPACAPGLTELAGCSGDCFGSTSVCADLREPMKEPQVNMTKRLPPIGTMRGYADLHVHMFSHLAMGGGVIAGRPYDPDGGVRVALQPDFATDLDLVSFVGTDLPSIRCPKYLPGCGKVVLHGDHWPIDDTAGLGTGDGARSNFGAPVFNGWPTWRSTTHQQVYYKWLERAWRGGLRLIVMLAVNNEVLCTTSKRLRTADCKDSMAGIERQLKAAVEFEDWIHRQPGGDWFRIVRTPDEAEEVIRAGNLAVVLGIEADSLFNCKAASPCKRSDFKEGIAKYRGLGARHIFPVHDFDNGLAGTAVWMDMLNIGNRIIEGRWYAVERCAQTDFVVAKEMPMRLAGFTVNAVVNKLQSDLNVPYPVYPSFPGCNTKGLSANGEDLIQELMNAGMMIDVDHMSFKSVQRTLAIAESRGGYPVAVGHGLFSTLYEKAGNRHERMRTRAELDRIRGSGGIVSVMTQDELTKKVNPHFRADGTTFVNDCLHSSKSFALNYLHATNVMRGPVAFGSDFNGLAQHVGPRFGDDGCSGDEEQWPVQQQTPRLRYPFTLEGFGTFDRQVTGQRTFDFNVDGLAHIGMFPDLIADMLTIGVTASELEPLFGSAKAYVDTWRRAEAKSQPQFP